MSPNTPKPPENHDTVPLAIWVPALVFTSILLLFIMWIYVHPPAHQPPVLRVLLSLLCGFAATFMTGTIAVQMDAPQTKFGKLALSAAGGVAVFVVVFFYVLP